MLSQYMALFIISYKSREGIKENEKIYDIQKFLISYRIIKLGLTQELISMLVLWAVFPCELVGKYRRFGGTYYLHL
jgi:hypothetical protein